MLESKNFCASYLTKFSVDLDEICTVVEICSFDELCTHFVSTLQYSGEKALFM